MIPLEKGRVRHWTQNYLTKISLQFSFLSTATRKMLLGTEEIEGFSKSSSNLKTKKDFKKTDDGTLKFTIKNSKVSTAKLHLFCNN